MFRWLRPMLRVQVTLNVGNFLNAVISFTIVAFAVFILIKAINTLQERMDIHEKAEEALKEPETKSCPYCYETDSGKSDQMSELYVLSGRKRP